MKEPHPPGPTPSHPPPVPRPRPKPCCVHLSQAEEGRERWRARLDRLQEDCSTERASAREEVSKLLAGSEEAEGTAGRASGEMEEASAALRASLTAEFAQVFVLLWPCNVFCFLSLWTGPTRFREEESAKQEMYCISVRVHARCLFRRF